MGFPSILESVFGAVLLVPLADLAQPGMPDDCRGEAVVWSSPTPSWARIASGYAGRGRNPLLTAGDACQPCVSGGFQQRGSNTTVRIP